MNTRQQTKTMYQKQIDNTKRILDKLDAIMRSTGEHPEGNSFYIDGSHGKLAETFATKRYNLFHYGLSALNVLEIGFNGGHSCLLFLLANPHSNIQLFDLGDHKYSRLCYDYLKSMFPGRLSMVWGNSTVTLSQFQSELPYDVMHIDGGHQGNILFSDIKNCCRLANENSTIIVDDISFHPKHMVSDLTEIVVEKLVSEELVQVIPPFYCVYHVIVKRNIAFIGFNGVCEHGLPHPNL
jgi:hypothetical protein